MRQLIQINVSLLHAGLPKLVHSFFDIRMNRRLIFSGCNIPEQHLKALSVSVRFNPLIANLGFSDVNLQFKALAPMMRTLQPDKDLSLIPVCRSYDSSARGLFSVIIRPGGRFNQAWCD